MRFELRYTPDTELYPFRDEEGKMCLAILIYPVSKKEKNSIHLMRWQMKKKFVKVMVWVARLFATRPIHRTKCLSNEEYARRFL